MIGLYLIEEGFMTLASAMFKSPVALTLKAEGLAIATLATLLFAQTPASWGMFALLILAPDFSMLGYLLGTRIGAFCYNIAHSYLLPLALLALSYAGQFPVLIPVALIWIAHIGFDRAIGYGLKYASGFRDTHLVRV